MALTKEDLIKVDFYSWLKDKYVIPSTGEKYTFDGFEYLEDITKRRWKPFDETFIMKPSQVGVTEIGLGLPLWMNSRGLPRWKGSAYFFPARAQLQDLMKARFFPLMDDETYFRPKLKSANLRYVNWADKPIYFRSGQTRRELISIAIDHAVIDEFDEFENPLTVVPTLEARFGQSDYGFLFGMSTPTIPDTGIDAAVNISNQFNWYIACKKCGVDFSPLNEVRTMGFDKVVVKAPLSNKVGFVCPNCHDLTQTNGAKGKWVQDSSNDSQKHAYCISRLFTNRHSLEKILTEYEEGLNVQEFYNSTLGLPYAAANARLNRTDIVSSAYGASEMPTFSKEPTLIGIDVGKKCNWVVGSLDGTKKVVKAYGTCDFDDLSGIVSRYNVIGGCIDLRPYEQEVKRFMRGKRGFMASEFHTSNMEDWFKLDRADAEVSGLGIKIIKSDRTQGCDRLIRDISVDKNFIFPACVKGDNVFINQMCAPVRIEKSDKDTGETKAKYNNGGRADHYFFACLYLLLSMQLKRNLIARPLEILY